MNHIFIIVLFAVIACVAVTALVCELRRDLMMLQQNSYRNERYMRWLRQSGDSTSTLRLLAIAALLLMLSRLSVPVISMALALGVTATASYRLLTARYKKPLVMTRRARRIMATALLLWAAVAAGVTAATWSDALQAIYCFTAVTVGAYAFSHGLTYVANLLLRPVENAINRRYRRDAEMILASMPELKIIGITGSYGKTSTKHYLHRILSEHFDTCMTPGSFNTTLGVIRTIREHLKPYNQVFIVEMGAKQPGDIKEICDLVHPTVGIVTAVGEQHLESFKSIENVQRTKFELIDALPADGIAILNDDFPYVASRVTAEPATVCRYAVNATDGAGYRITGITYTPRGTRFTILGPEGMSMELDTRLVGECNVSNLTAAVIAALKLGVPADKIKYAVSKIEQVEHRLQVKRTPGGITILDDAFNSNPHGSRMALDVLAGMTGGKRIVITPGMIELGERQEELNREFGRRIARSVDVAIIVGRYNRDAITTGINDEGFAADALHVVDTFTEAQALLSTFIKPGDTVLYENDLPDTFK